MYPYAELDYIKTHMHFSKKLKNRMISIFLTLRLTVILLIIVL